MAPWRRKNSSQQAIVVHMDSSPAQTSGADASENAEEKEEFDPEDMAEMLPIRKPKNLLDGASSSIKLVTGGVAAGAASLVAMPVAGAREKGVKGFASGLAKGIASAVMLSTAGAIGGAVQITRGAVQTPISIVGAASGKQWDKVSRTYRYYSLPEEEMEVEATEAEWAKKLAERREERKKRRKDGAVEDTSFYDMLGVTPEATNSEIKRAYLHKARELHPDKNPDDPEAKGRFQRLGEAYQVLSNEDSRAKYDAKGLDGLKDTQLMDSATMYAMLFGSEAFEDLIGELQLAALMQQAEAVADVAEVSFRHMTHKQRQREVGCATKLAAKLQPYVDDEMTLSDFEKEVEAQATELAKSAFGELLTHTIGRIYVYKASQALRLNIGETLRQKGHTWGTNAKALRSMLKLYRVSKEAQKLGDEKEAMQEMQKEMATFLEGAWYISVVDVEATLRHVCKKVLTDRSIDKMKRRKRASALKRIGEIFLEQASAEGKDTDGRVKSLAERLKDVLPQEAAASSGAAAAAADEDDEDDDAELADLADLDVDAHQSSPACGMGPVSREELAAMSVRDLKAIMVAQGLSVDGLLEKSEFIDAICNHAVPETDVY